MVQDYLDGQDFEDKQGKLDKIVDLKSKITTEGQAFGKGISNKVNEVGRQATNKTDSVLNSVGEGMSCLAGSIRENAPSEGTMASAAVSVAEGLQSSGEYLSHHGVEDIAKDVTEVVRKHPMTSLWMGVGVGVLIGRALTRKQ